MEGRAPIDIGQQIRSLRQQRGLSLRMLAELCKLSPNTISLIERGVTSPSIATLHRLATALGVHIVSFFEEQETDAVVILTRANERSRSGSSSVLLESLGSGLLNQTLEPFIVTLKPGADAKRPVMAHAGHELVYCLEGELEYEVANQRYRLLKGDSLFFEARLPHCWFNPGSEAVVFILIFQTAAAQESLEQHLH